MNQITPNNLDIIIFDVEHGNCAFLQTDAGETMLIDCGHKEDFSPAKFIKDQGWIGGNISKVVITHHDSDHISDLINVEKLLNPYRYHTNHIPGSLIRQKDNPAEGTQKHKYIKIKEYPSVSAFPYQDISVSHFKNNLSCNDGEDLDINYHSVVSFIEYGDFTICFPGDITDAGLKNILDNDKNDRFLELIKKTTILVAPHHGRLKEEERSEDTYLSKLLKKMEPDLIIVSDKGVKEENINTVATDYYEQRVPNGITFGLGTPYEKKRYVLSTRNDNTIHFKVQRDGGLNPDQYSYNVRLNAFKKEIDDFISDGVKNL